MEWTHSTYTVELKDNGKIYLSAANTDDPNMSVVMELNTELATQIAMALLRKVDVVERRIYETVERLTELD